MSNVAKPSAGWVNTCEQLQGKLREVRGVLENILGADTKDAGVVENPVSCLSNSLDDDLDVLDQLVEHVLEQANILESKF